MHAIAIRPLSVIVTLIGVVAGAGCLDDASQDYEEPILDGKSDAVTAHVEIKGELGYGVPVSSAFDTSKLHGYTSRGVKDASVSSLLANFVLPDDGEYLAVATMKGSAYADKSYDLSLTCNSDRCTSVPANAARWTVLVYGSFDTPRSCSAHAPPKALHADGRHRRERQSWLGPAGRVTSS